MPAVLIKMLVACEPGTISLLPALPVKFPEGSIEGILCRGQVEIRQLSWSKTGIQVSLLSEKEQKISIVAPSEIKDMSIEEGKCEIEETGDRHGRMISLSTDEMVTLQLDF